MKKNLLLSIVLALFFISCSSTKEVKLDNRCYEKPETGMCKALFYKYYFNKEESKCKQFAWGGCGGNIPFHNLKDCQKACEK